MAKQILSEVDRLRARQAKRVMRQVGPLLDELDGIPNDTTGELKSLAPELFRRLEKLRRAVEGPGGAD